MATTTNFGWETPDDTDLVKDGALAMRTLGNSIDSSFVDLKGGTTGQILTKNSNTDLDFTWSAPNPGDITAVTAGTGISGGGTSGDVTITNSMATAIDAKGDLIAGTGDNAFSRLGVGSNGQVLTANSATATGLEWAAPASVATSLGFTAGKNAIINGDFFINQRNFTTTSGNSIYGFDRWRSVFSGGTYTYSAQTFTPGTAPVSGYEGANFARITTSGQSAASDYASFAQSIENVRTFAGQTVTLSFWARSSSGTPGIAAAFEQRFGSGGSPSANVVTHIGRVTTSTSWTRYSITVAVPNISGKTIGTNANSSDLTLYIFTSGGSSLNAYVNGLGIQNTTIDFWGVQIEAGNTATAFQTATGTIQGELAACQRYYQVLGGVSNGFPIAVATATGATQFLDFPITFLTQMRTTPTATRNGTWLVSNSSQPTPVFLNSQGFSFEMISLGSGQVYTHPNSTDDTLTFDAEL